MATVKLNVLERNSGRDCVWEVEAKYDGGVTEVEANTIYKEVREVCGDRCSGGEQASVWHFYRSITWRCAGKAAALDVMCVVSEKMGGLGGRIDWEKKVVAGEKLWAAYLNYGSDVREELSKAQAEIEELKNQAVNIKEGESDDSDC